MKVQANLVAHWEIPVGSSNVLRVSTQSSGCGEEKYLAATRSVLCAKIALRLCFSEDVTIVSGGFHTNLMASSTSVGLVIICRVLFGQLQGRGAG